MNFKVGELAIVVGCHTDPQFIGKIVTLREKFLSSTYQCNAWKVDIDVSPYSGISEKHLRPIRDQPGQDETLTWAPVPQKEMV